MQSPARDVKSYIQESPAERQEALSRFRDLCRVLLKDFAETLAYSGPYYSRCGEVQVGLASQKQLIGLYILRTDVINAHKYLVVEKMWRATQESTGPVC